MTVSESDGPARHPDPKSTLAALRAQAEPILATARSGRPLDRATAVLTEFALCAAVTSLDAEGTRALAANALDAGITSEQLQEVLSLLAGLGVHSWMEGSRHLASVLRERGEGDLDAPLDEARQALWDRFIGEDPYWVPFEEEVPGFLEDLLRLSPEAFESFFPFCAIPWRTATVTARTKELIALASDATPAHSFGPGFRLHLRGAIHAGAGRQEILDVLEIAAATPPSPGVD